MPDKVSLNGNDYVVRDRTVRGSQVGVEDYLRLLFVPQFDTSGGQSQQQIGPRDSKTFPNLTHGFGRNRIASDSARNPPEYRRFYDSTCDTRFVDIRLPIRSEPTIHSFDLEVLRAMTDFKGDVHGLWEANQSGDVRVRTLTGSTLTWGGGGTVITGTTSVGLDMIAHKTHLVVLYASTNDHITERSTDGITWSAAATPLALNKLSNSVTAHEDIDAGLLAEIGGEIVAILWNEGNGTIVFESDPDVADTWAVESLTIASGNGPQGVAVMPGVDNEDKLYLCTREGLYEIDTAPATWTSRKIFSLVAHNDNGRRMAVHSDGALWFSQGVDDSGIPTTYRMFISTDGTRRIEVVPNDFSDGDGVVTEMLGPIRQWHSSGGFMYATIGGGAASRQARIVCHNGSGWHSMHRHVVADQEIEPFYITGEDDGAERLLFAIRTATDVTEVKFLGNHNANPRSGVTINREDDGYIDFPYIDGGMPLTPTAYLRIGVNAEDLSSTTAGEWINPTYGIDDGSGGIQARTNTDPGDILSGTSSLGLPSSAPGQGEKSVNFGVRLVLNRDNTAVAFDAASSGGNQNQTSITVSHTTGSGSNRALIVGVSTYDNDLTGVPTGVTYAGSNMTLFGSREVSVGGGFFITVSMWYIKAPSTGSNSIIASFSASIVNTVLGGVSVTNARQDPPTGFSVATQNTSSTSVSVTLLSGPDDLVIDVLALESASVSQAATVGASQTSRWNSDNTNILGAGSTEPGADGTTTMSWDSFTNSSDNLLIAAVINAVGDTNTPVLKDLEIRYLKQPTNLQGFRFTIDVAETARLRGDRTPPEIVVTEWETAKDLGTLNAFEWGTTGTLYVKVHEARFFTDLQGGDATRGQVAGSNLSQRAGFIEVDCSEVDG